MANISNPNEVIAIRRQTTTLGVSAYFNKPEEDTPPLKNSGYDRFEFVYIDSNDKSAIKGNMKISDVASFKMRLQESVKELALAENRKNSIGGNKATPAYTTLLTGSYKGKTVAQVLTDDPNQKEGLLKAKKWLEDNLSKYPGNKKMIDAIDEGIKLLAEGNLSEKQEVKNVQFYLYKGDTKYYRQKKNDKGHYLCHQLTIKFDSSRNYPYAVTIDNFYAPLDNNAIKLSEKHDAVSKTMHCTEREITYMLKKMEEAESFFNAYLGKEKWQNVIDAQYKPEK